MRFFIDECLSPRIAEWLNATGQHDALHPLHVGRRGERDDVVLARCISEDRVIVTENARDFRALVGAVDIHPGLIILPALGRDETWRLLQEAIRVVTARGDPSVVMVNHVLEVARDGTCTLKELLRRVG